MLSYKSRNNFAHKPIFHSDLSSLRLHTHWLTRFLAFLIQKSFPFNLWCFSAIQMPRADFGAHMLIEFQFQRFTCVVFCRNS